ncbi:winged helix DNA-binding protein [Phenylobacterium sp. LjRoot225]|uniref:MarR family winged helix-turn-helix transcriptional regulator n=1 Tax=Phenylobacterium sp. LjRoot225 TaxID=3342285 RepID=UPI003ECE59EF
MTKPKTVKASEGAEVRLDPQIIAVMRMTADMQRASSRHLKSLWRQKGLTERGLFILELVNSGLDRPSKLIEYFDVLPSTITFETEKLVSAGLLNRESLPTDRRVVQLSLTEKGHEVHRETTKMLNAFLLPRLNALAPGELETFLTIFQKIVEPIPFVEHGGADDEGEPQAAASAAGRTAAAKGRHAS